MLKQLNERFCVIDRNKYKIYLIVSYYFVSSDCIHIYHTIMLTNWRVTCVTV